MFNKLLIRIVVLILHFLILCSCSYNGIFFPVDDRTEKKVAVTVEQFSLVSSDDTVINVYMIRPNAKPKSTLLVFHGSGSTVNNWIHVLQNMTEHGYQIAMMEYRGFAGSEGEATHVNVVQDATHVLSWLNTKLDRQHNPLLVMGQSYGAQIAINVLSQKPHLADGLIIEGAFTSFKEIAINSTPTLVRPFTWVTFKEPYNGRQLLQTIPLSKLIVHSKDDNIVPFAMGQSLYQSATAPKQFWEVSGGHITATKQHADELDKRLSTLFALDP